MHRLPADESIDEWSRILRAEYNESPGLSLTHPQVLRLWNLDPSLADAVLKSLMESRFLWLTPKQTFVRVE